MPPTFEVSLMFSFEVAGSSTGNIFEESPPLEFIPITIIIVTPRGPPPRILILASSLLQLLVPPILIVVSSQTPPTIVTPLLVVPHSTSTPSLVPASTQALHNVDSLKEIFEHSIMNFLCLLRQYVPMFLEGHHSIELGHSIFLNYLDNIKNIGGSE